MYKDVINYKLADGVTEEQLLKAAAEILESWMKDLDGFISWEINKSENGYVDIVTWEDVESAKKAEEKMKELPKDNAWYACYDFSTIYSENLDSLFNYNS